MNRPVPPQLSLPAYIAWLPPLIRFLASALQYQQDSEAYMDWLEAQKDELAVRLMALEAIPPILIPPIIEPPPALTVRVHSGSPWMDEVLAPITTNIDLDLIGVRRGALTYSYRVVSRSDFAKVIDYWRRTTRPLWVEAFKLEPADDVCDWWAWAFRGWVLQIFQLDSIGFVMDNGSHHSYNLVVYNDQTWELFDPQYDSYAVVGTTGHSFQKGLILL